MKQCQSRLEVLPIEAENEGQVNLTEVHTALLK